jgi:hypothetical protein
MTMVTTVVMTILLMIAATNPLLGIYKKRLWVRLLFDHVVIAQHTCLISNYLH